MSSSMWRKLGAYINTPASELDRIETEFMRNEDRMKELIRIFLLSHPSPSWLLVAWGLYLTSWRDDDSDSCLRSLDHLQRFYLEGESHELYTITEIL